MHSDEVVTDVNVRRLRSAVGGDAATIAWDYPGRTMLEVRILRSRSGFATGADEGSRSPAVADGGAEERSEDGAAQTLVYQGASGSFRDHGLDEGVDYFYTVFARHPGGEWHQWERLALRPAPSPERVA